jgi:hypothetical protein
MTQEEHWEQAHKDALKHFNACMMELYEDGEGTETSAPYCGCDVCVVREILYAAYDELEKHFAEKAKNNDNAS